MSAYTPKSMMEIAEEKNLLSRLVKAQLDQDASDFNAIMQDVFSLVEPTSHWKDQIHCEIPVALLDAVKMAVPYMTGTEVEDLGRDREHSLVTEIKAPGYWLGPCN